MAVPFGFAVGDFITVGKLVHDIIQAISESRGAAADYRSLVSTLRSLYSCTNSIKDALENFAPGAWNFKSHEAALINGLMYEMDCRRDLLNAFLDNTYKYTASFLPTGQARELEEAQTVISLFRGRKAGMKRLEKAWRKVSWAVFRKEDVQKLERDVQGHLLALQIYETFLQHSSLARVEKSTAEITLVTRETEVTIMAMFDLLKSVYNMIPPQISDKMNKRQPVFFEDALGRSIELPREFCVSKEKFQRHLEILFDGMPGHDKVARGEYQLEDATEMTTLSVDNWHLKIRAGARVVMTLLFQLASRAKGAIAQICPRCDTINNESNLRQGMTECFNCKLLFEIVDTMHITELRDDIWHEVGRAADASNHLWPQQQEKKMSMEQDAFRRIRYICETLPGPTVGGTAQQQLLNGMNLNQQQTIMNPAQAYYTKMYQQQLTRLRSEMAHRHGRPASYSEQARKEFMETTDQQAKQFVSEMMRRDRGSLPSRTGIRSRTGSPSNAAANSTTSAARAAAAEEDG